jgi:hypothetical protein
MFVYKKKKFLINEITEVLAPEKEYKGLTLFLELLLEEENYELATIVKSRLDCIKFESKNAN